jgi:hypothetical protein
MRYAVDLLRNTFYIGQPDAGHVLLDSIGLNVAVVAGMFLIFMLIGTAIFVRNEKNR